MADAAEIIIHDEGDEGEELGEALIEEDATGSKTLALEDLFKEEYKPSKLFEEWSTKKVCTRLQHYKNAGSEIAVIFSFIRFSLGENRGIWNTIPATITGGRLFF